MTSKKTLNTRNLEALGAERLAELLIEISKGRPAAQRLPRLELVGAQGTAELAREVRHRMATIRRSRAVIDSRRRRDLVDDLELCRRTIVDRIAVEDAAEALDLMWQYMGLANPIQNRLHYTDETIAGAFNASDPGAIASAASPDPHKLADRAFEALTQNAHGQFDGLIGALTPALGHEGLERLKLLMTEYSNTPNVQLPEAHRRKIHWRHRGTDVEAETAERLRLQTARSALQDSRSVPPRAAVEAAVRTIRNGCLRCPDLRHRVYGHDDRPLKPFCGMHGVERYRLFLGVGPTAPCP